MEEEKYIYKYITLNRISYILFQMIFFAAGLIFLFLVENLIVKLLISLVILFVILSIIKAIFFKSIEICEKKLIFNWYFFKSEIIENRDLSVILHHGIGWGGWFFIKNKNKPIKSYLFMNISIFPLDYESLDDIRKQFIEKNLNAGVEDGWLY